MDNVPNPQKNGRPNKPLDEEEINMVKNAYLKYRVSADTGGNSKFKEFLDTNGIQQILCRIKHPQSNGKVEKLFSLYKMKRCHFQTKEEFVVWYNEIRLHKSLKFEVLETPEQAFVRKLRAEV